MVLILVGLVMADKYNVSIEQLYTTNNCALLGASGSINILCRVCSSE